MPGLTGAQRPTTARIEVRAVVDAGEDDPPNVARARALAEARRQAIREATGTRVRNVFYEYSQKPRLNAQIVGRFTTVAQEGRILHEEVVSESLESTPGRRGYRYGLTLRARVMSLDPAKSCRVRVRLSREVLGEGDPAAVTVSVDRQARLYLFSLGPGNELTALIPAPEEPAPTLTANRPWTFPTASDRARGARLRATLPEGVKAQLEWLLAVAVDPQASLAEVPATLSSLLERLAALSPNLWCEDRVGYTIHAQGKERL
jgi:hypothetical protein